MRGAVFDADSAATLEDQPLGVRFGRDGQVGARFRWAQIGASRTPAAAVIDGELVKPGAFLLRAVEIGIVRNAGLHGSVDAGFRQRPFMGDIVDMQRTAGAVQFAVAAFLVLRLLEIGQDIVPVPALAATLAPVVIVGGGAPHINSSVDRRGAAENLAAGLVERAVVEVGFRLGFEHPIHVRVGVVFRVAERDMDPGVGIARPGFQQQHAVFARLT